MRFQKMDFTILLKLAIPLLLSGIVESSNGFMGTLFLARLGPDALAAGSLVNWFFATLLVVLWGVLTAVSVLVAHRCGANDKVGVAWVFRDGIWLCVFLTIPAMALIWHMSTILLWLGQQPALVAKAVPYLHALTWSVFADFVGIVFMQLLIGLGHTRTNLIFSLCWVPLTIFFNYIFIFGKLGLPAFGMAGLGWGTTLSYWVTSIGLGVYMLARPTYRAYWWTLTKFVKPKYLKELLKIGLPMGLMYCVEIAFFFTLTLLMGRIGTAALVATQITMQFVGFFVSLAFAMAQAVTVRMGHLLGAKEPLLANRAAHAGILLSFAAFSLVALAEWLFPHTFIALDFRSDHLLDPAILHYTLTFFAIAAVFQWLESVRLALYGALRALKDTRFTLLTSFIAFWCVAIPVGYGLANMKAIGAYGYWWALVLSTIVSSTLLYCRFRLKMQKLIVWQERDLVPQP